MEYGYIRTSKLKIDGSPGLNPATQENQLFEAGVLPACIYRDIGVSGSTGTSDRRGWKELEGRLRPNDTVTVVALDRIARKSLDMLRVVIRLSENGVKLKSLTMSEMEWAKYLNAEESSPDAFIGRLILQVLAYTAEQEMLTIRRRTKAGIERARAEGKQIGRPTLESDRISAIRYLDEAGKSGHEIAQMLGISRRTVARYIDTKKE